jgi:hypothetical protein
MYDNPAGVLGVVLGDLGASELPLSHRDDYSLINGEESGTKEIIEERVQG